MTKLQINIALDYRLDSPCALLVQLAAAATHNQTVDHCNLQLGPSDNRTVVPAHDGIGTRIWTQQSEYLTATYDARVSIDRPNPNWSNLAATPLAELPGETVCYLFNSLYCSIGAFDPLVSQQFKGLAGGALIAAMCEYLGAEMTYGSDTDNAQLSAQSSFAMRRGVCRDYAHILISMARAADIPARFVSCYAPDVLPQDFHATVEVFLEGTWHLVDPTGMATADEMAIIGIGRDATDVSFLTSFGSMQMIEQRVNVHRA
jgi:transglutaminase-like putative cysteine protease